MLQSLYLPPNSRTCICNQNSVPNLGHHRSCTVNKNGLLGQDGELTNARTWPDAFEVRVRGRSMRTFPGDRKNSSSSTQAVSTFNKAPFQKQPCLCDCFRQRLSKIDAEGIERGSVHPRVRVALT